MKSFTLLSLMSLMCFGLLAQEKTKHESVDLGLSVKWATCNVGSDTPEGYGDYYAWAETSTKENYTWRSYKHCDGSSTKLNKYCVGNSYGKSDNLSEMEAADDVATQLWGVQWRTPTDAEMTELREKCNWNWTTQNGVSGYVITSRKNGNSIFLPASGSRQDKELLFVGSKGIYTTRTVCKNYSFSVFDLYFTDEKVERADISRRFGVSVRPVCK